MATISSTLRLDDKMSRALSSITKAMNSSLTAMRSIKGIELGPEFAQAAADIRLAEDAVEKMNASLNETGSAAEKAGDAMSTMEYLGTKALTAIMNAAKQAIGTIVELTDEVLSLNARMDNVTNSQVLTAELWDDIYAAAQRSRGSYYDMADAALSVYSRTGDTFESIQDALYFTELWNKSAAGLGRSAEEASAAFEQLIQGMGLGVIQGQDLKAVMSYMPEVLADVADQIGIGVGELREWASEGKLTAEVFRAAFYASADDIEARLAKMPMTIGQIGTSVTNVLQQAFQPLLELIGKAANWIYDNWEDVKPLFIGVAAAVAAVSVSLAAVALKSILAKIGIESLASSMLTLGIRAAAIGIAVTVLVSLYKKASGEGKILEKVLLALGIAVTALTVAVTIFGAKLTIATGGISLLLGMLGSLLAWLLPVSDATEDVADTTDIAADAAAEYQKMLEEMLASMDSTADAATGLSSVLDKLATTEYTNAVQAVRLAKRFGSIVQAGNLTTASMNELSSTYDYLNELVPNFEKNLLAQDEALSSAIDGLQAMNAEADGLYGLSSAIDTVTAAYYAFARAAAFVQAYQGLMTEAATQIIQAEIAASDISGQMAAVAETALPSGMRAITAPGEQARELQLAEQRATAAAGEEQLEKYFTGMLEHLDTIAEFGDMFSSVTSGKAIRTKAEVDIDSEDLRLLLDLGTLDYQITYQILEPQIAFNIDTVRETADVDELLDAAADRIMDMADASLV